MAAKTPVKAPRERRPKPTAPPVERVPPPQPQPCQGCGELTLCPGWETRCYSRWLFDLRFRFSTDTYLVSCKARICPTCMETASRLFEMGLRARQIAGRNEEMREHLDRLELWWKKSRALEAQARGAYEEWAPRLGLDVATLEDVAEVIREVEARWMLLSRYAFLGTPKRPEQAPDTSRWVMADTGERTGLARYIDGQWTDATGHWIRTPQIWHWWEVERFAYAARRRIRWKIGADVLEAEAPQVLDEVTPCSNPKPKRQPKPAKSHLKQPRP